MTRRKKEISFTANWLLDPCSKFRKGKDRVFSIENDSLIKAVYEKCTLGKRIIRALGKKEGKIKVRLERVE